MLKGEIEVGDKIFLQWKDKVVSVKEVEIEKYEMPHGSHDILETIGSILVDLDGEDRRIYVDGRDYESILSKKTIIYRISDLKEKLKKYENALRQME